MNLTNCEQEPIHIPGSIQNFGFLLGLYTGDLTIDYCSSNTLELAGIGHQQLLGKGFHLVFGEAQTTNLKRYIDSYSQTLTVPSELELMNKNNVSLAKN